MPRSPDPATLPLPAAVGDDGFCRALLPHVSRTFAACINLLPAPVDHQVLVAYLLCRIADTVEDTADLPGSDKVALLARFEACLAADGPDAAPLRAAFPTPRIADELLTREADAVLRSFRALGPAAGAEIRPWVAEMCRGMAGFAADHPVAAPGRLASLETLEDLDRYCWYVAGTVGHLLTGLFRLHSPRIDDARHQRLKQLATGFGLGLQLTNIIKDVADDRSRGWSFLPAALCRAEGLDPEALLDPAHAAAARRVMERLIAKAQGHLDEALAYTLTLPRRDYRLRLFCLAPLYFAVLTLNRAARDPRLLDPGHKVKITRAEVGRTLLACHLVAPSDTLVRWWYGRLKKG